MPPSWNDLKIKLHSNAAFCGQFVDLLKSILQTPTPPILPKSITSQPTKTNPKQTLPDEYYSDLSQLNPGQALQDLTFPQTQQLTPQWLQQYPAFTFGPFELAVNCNNSILGGPNFIDFGTSFNDPYNVLVIPDFSLMALKTYIDQSLGNVVGQLNAPSLAYFQMYLNGDLRIPDTRNAQFLFNTNTGPTAGTIFPIGKGNILPMAVSDEWVNVCSEYPLILHSGDQIRLHYQNNDGPRILMVPIQYPIVYFYTCLKGFAVPVQDWLVMEASL